MTKKSYGLAAVLATAALLAFAAQVSAQSYPARPIRIIVAFPPGAALDSTARTLGQEVGKSVGQPVLVENRPGASYIVGMVACAKAAPDGYTLCLNTNSFNELLFTNLPYDPDKDFAPIIHVVSVRSMLVAKGTAPFNSFKELIALSKAKPGSVNWATWGPATSPDIILRWIANHLSVNITGVPYKGGAPTIPAVLAGEVDIIQSAVGLVLPHIKAGKLKPIAIIGERRTPLLPDMPTLAEVGANPGLVNWFGLFAPGMTPKPVIDRLNEEFAKAMRTPAAQEFFRTSTLEPVGGSPEEFGRFLKVDAANAAKVFKAIGIRPSALP